MTEAPDPELRTSLEVTDGRARLRVGGEIDLFTAPDFAAALAAAAEAAAHVAVDLRDVEFMDSTGLKALLEVRRRLADTGGSVEVAVVDEGPVARLLELAGVRDLFAGDGG